MGWTMLLKVLSATLASVFLLAPAHAQSWRKVLDDFGFFGNWAPNCDSPATLTNSRRRAFATRGGEIHFTENFGHGKRHNTYVVFDAKRIAPDKVLLRIQFNGKLMQDLTMVKENGRLRTITNQGSGGQYLVKDGVVISNGNETPWLSHCGKD